MWTGIHYLIRLALMYILNVQLSMACKAFSVAAPRIWNSLPSDVFFTESLSSF